MASPIFDTIMGINRPALNAQIQQGQALSGYRSAQTEDAMTEAHLHSLDAQMKQREMDAQDQMEAALTGTGPGQMPATQAHAVVTMARAMGVRNPDQLAQFMQTMQKVAAGNTLGDVTKLGTPEATAAGQVTTGKPAEPVQVPNEFTVQPGMPQPQIGQTPLGVAQTAAAGALAGLHNVQAAAGGFNPNSGIKSIDEAAMPGMAKAMAEGRLAVPSSYAMGRNPSLAQVYSMAIGINPSLSQADQPTIQHTENAFVNGVQGRNLTAINTAEQHIGVVRGLVTALNNNDIPAANHFFNWIGTQTGNPAPTNLGAALSMLSPEITRSTLQSGAGSEEERTAHAAFMGIAAAPEQAEQALNVYETLLAGRAASLGQEYRAGGGKKDFNKFLLPATVDALHLSPTPPTASPGIPGSVSSGTQPTPAGPHPASAPAAVVAAPGQPSTVAAPTATPAPGTAPAGAPTGGGPQPLPPQALAALKEGQHTTFGNGQTWTLQNGQPQQVQ